MSLSMIDGLLTAAVIGPRLVGPAEVTPWIWDHARGDRPPRSGREWKP